MVPIIIQVTIANQLLFRAGLRELRQLVALCSQQVISLLNVTSIYIMKWTKSQKQAKINIYFQSTNILFFIRINKKCDM